MIDAAVAALKQIFTPPFRSVLYKSLGLTLLLLALAWAGLHRLALGIVPLDHPWLHWILTLALNGGLVILLAFLLGPVSLIVAGFFLDDLADIVEAEIYPPGHTGQAIAVSQSLYMTLRFALVSAVANVVALMLLLVPGVNAVAFLLANGYLFGREYFALAATRFRSLDDADDLRRRNGLQLFLAGLLIAGFVATPGLNLLTPLFGVAFMVRVHKRLSPELR
jgi:CysZ protein